VNGLHPDALESLREGREEGKKGGLKEAERLPGPPTIYDRSPPLIMLNIV